jgi:cytochrome P450
VADIHKFVVKSIYRLTFHPLAKYPGPLLSRITSLSIYLQALTGDRHLNHLQEHQHYGPVVRIAPNQLSFSEPAALRSIYQSSRANNPLRKAPFYETLDAPSGAYSTHTEISRRKHAFRRRVLEGAFSDSSMRSLEPFVIDNVNTLLSLLSDGKDSGTGWSKPKNMSDLATWFAYDVMGDLVFGERFHCLTSPDHRFVPRLLMTSSAFIYPVCRFTRVVST